MILLPLYNNLNINIIEQRLIQIFAYFIGTQFLNELMYLGIEYAFKFSNILNLENIKGNFYMNNLFYKNHLFNIKCLFRYIFKTNYKIFKYNSFLLFKNFYTIINKINPLLNILDFIIQVGARSNKIQYQQIVGMRGFLNTSRNFIVNIPLLHNFERGLDVTEYLISSYGVRKGLLDTSLQTSESGYLTRRLVEVVQDIIIKEHYCGSKMFLILRKYNTITGSLFFPTFQILFNKYLYQFTNNIEFYIKTPLLCYSGRSTCSVCLGFICNLKVLKGESVGVIFGELLGEPSTQLTLRTFHTGGVLNIINKNNYYIFKNKINYSLIYKNFKFISLIAQKKLSQNSKINLLTTCKSVIYNNYFKTLFNFSNRLHFKTTNSNINFLIIYKFNYLIQNSNYKGLERFCLQSCKIMLYKILINFYSINMFIKNNLNEWTLIFLNNNLNYFIFNYFISHIGGLVLPNKINNHKSIILFNTNIIY